MVRFSPARCIQGALVCAVVTALLYRSSPSSQSPSAENHHDQQEQQLQRQRPQRQSIEKEINDNPLLHHDAQINHPNIDNNNNNINDAHKHEPAAHEVEAAKQKREAAENLIKEEKHRISSLKKVERLEHFYSDVPLPKKWIDGDWTGLPEDKLATATQAEKSANSIKRYAFNAMLSAQIPMRRPLRDMRTPLCQAQLYPDVTDLPTVSVIICFAEEMRSSLFRTVWSVLDRTPRSLLAEIILVNDNSTAVWLQEDLAEYMKGMPSIVKIVKSTDRLGLIRARTLGAQNAIGDLLVFLDSHCEASDGWYEPIAARIQESRSTIVCPVIDSISDRTMDYNGGGGTAVGGFHWTLDFTWIYRPIEAGKTRADPMVSPTMAGGLFAVNRIYWGELGGYDLEMGGWGGENLELSFRVWTCGGTQEIHPCSHVGHIFRAQHPYVVPGGFSEVYMKNSARLAATWLDEYADVFFRIRPKALTSGYGDVSERLDLRKKLDCKPFKWYMDKFFQDKFVPTPDVLKFEGQLKNKGVNKCVDTLGHQHPGEKLGMYGCHPDATPSLSQAFVFTKTGQLRIIWDLCWDVPTRGPPPTEDSVEAIQFSHCRDTNVWVHKPETDQIQHVRSKKCMKADGDDLVVSRCDDADTTQKWNWSGRLNA